MSVLAELRFGAGVPSGLVINLPVGRVTAHRAVQVSQRDPGLRTPYPLITPWQRGDQFLLGVVTVRQGFDPRQERRRQIQTLGGGAQLCPGAAGPIPVRVSEKPVQRWLSGFALCRLSRLTRSWLTRFAVHLDRLPATTSAKPHARTVVVDSQVWVRAGQGFDMGPG